MIHSVAAIRLASFCMFAFSTAADAAGRSGKTDPPADV